MRENEVRRLEWPPTPPSLPMTWSSFGSDLNAASASTSFKIPEVVKSFIPASSGRSARA